MLTRFPLLLAVIVSMPGVVHAGAMEFLEELGRVLQSEPAWTATYHQVYLAAGMTIGEEADGVVWAAWPDRALFRTGDPPLRWMGLEGRSVRLLDLEVPACDDHRLSDEEFASIPLAAVLDPRGAVDRFSVLDHGEHGFALVPHGNGGVARVEVDLDVQGLPRRIRVLDPQGGSNSMRFSGWRASDGAPADRWLPTPPDDIECVADLDRP